MSQRLRSRRRPDADMIPFNTRIRSRWVSKEKLGQGAFGQIFAGVNVMTGEGVAIKVERQGDRKATLAAEVNVLKVLQRSPLVVRFVSAGSQDEPVGFRYLVMQRLGKNLATLRRDEPHGRFSVCTACNICLRMINAIESVHQHGFIHRDIKPSNFCIGYESNDTRSIYLIDFNLARRYRHSTTHELLAPRANPGFRGTARYASVYSHQKQELSRRDDLWSVFYVLVEMVTGSLPWRRMRDKTHIGELKSRFSQSEMVRSLPSEFTSFYLHLETLHFEDQPDYDYLRSLLHIIADREGFDENSPYDWSIRLNGRAPFPRIASASAASSASGPSSVRTPVRPSRAASDARRPRSLRLPPEAFRARIASEEFMVCMSPEDGGVSPFLTPVVSPGGSDGEEADEIIMMEQFMRESNEMEGVGIGIGIGGVVDGSSLSPGLNGIHGSRSMDGNFPSSSSRSHSLTASNSNPTFLDQRRRSAPNKSVHILRLRKHMSASASARAQQTTGDVAEYVLSPSSGDLAPANKLRYRSRSHEVPQTPPVAEEAVGALSGPSTSSPPPPMLVESSSDDDMKIARRGRRGGGADGSGRRYRANLGGTSGRGVWVESGGIGEGPLTISDDEDVLDVVQPNPDSRSSRSSSRAQARRARGKTKCCVFM